MKIDERMVDKSSLRVLASAVISKYPVAYSGLDRLPNELLEPILSQTPELAIRFLH